MELKIKALSPKIGTEIPLPRFATAGAACMDLCACIDEAVTLAAGERRLVPTGIAIALPSADYAALVFARGGLGIKKGVCLSNGVGVIDSDYRGEIGVGLMGGGNRQGVTRVASVRSYDQDEAREYAAPHRISAGMLVIALLVRRVAYGGRPGVKKGA